MSWWRSNCHHERFGKLAFPALALCQNELNNCWLPFLFIRVWKRFAIRRAVYWFHKSIRIISDIMSFTKEKNIPAFVVFLDLEKAFDTIEWRYLQKCLETFNFSLRLRQWILMFYKDIMSYVLNNGYATKHFILRKGVRQGCLWHFICHWHWDLSYYAISIIQTKRAFKLIQKTIKIAQYFATYFPLIMFTLPASVFSMAWHNIVKQHFLMA